ncbi:MAG: ribokinase [Bacteroidaceae bacterium]|nr:ribokinase [Bacteroidaceae bacterium]
MSERIVVIGSCNTDMVINTERLPQPGETIIGGNFFMNAGGKGANQAVAAARLGGRVSFMAKVGNDHFGSRSIEQYKSEGIEVEHILVDNDNPSGVALIMVDAKGENCIAVASGANALLRPEDIDKATDTIERGDIVLMQLETPLETVEYASRIAREKGKKVILNPAPALHLPESLLNNLYMIIANETETEYISGIKITDMDSICRAADIISSRGVENVVITLGSKGAFVKENGAYHQVPAIKVKAVDATAAGDTFCGALCVALAEGKDILEAVEFANRCASVTVTRLGAQSSLPYRSEIDGM